MASNQARPYRDKQWLREKYVDDGLTQQEIADICDVDVSTISNWMGKFDISIRWDRKVEYQTRPDGYVIHRDRKGGGECVVKAHRLLAVAEFGLDAVRDCDVHHKNGIRWDNRPSNLELHSHSDHSRLHGEERAGTTKHRDKEWLRKRHHVQGSTVVDMAIELSVSPRTIHDWMKKHGIELIDYGDMGQLVD